jgi:CRISPR-associated endonuclease Csn1
MTPPRPQEYVLGIDLGSNSLGWAVIGLEGGQPAKLLRAGVRVFEAATEGDRESGQEESRNKARREARSHRVLLRHRTQRLKKVFNLLEQFGLLPPWDTPSSGTSPGSEYDLETAFRKVLASLNEQRPPSTLEERRQNFLSALDQAILASPWFTAKKASELYPEPAQTLPYILRATALDERLEPYFLGRALYHLAQRRGFLSNRKGAPKKDEKLGEVKKGINELRQKMAEAGARTLGEYFSRLAPSEQRIRGCWTARSMYEEEFNKLWEAQAKVHPELLTGECKKELHQGIFFQRPLKFDPQVIGHCELEPEERRAPAYLLISQRFRLLQTLNNLKILPPGEPERDLTPADRAKLVEALELQGDRTFAQIRQLLGLTKSYGFNLERGGEKIIKGNRTNADFYAVFGERWLQMSREEREQAVQYVYGFEKPDKLKEAAKRKWGLDDATAEKLADISFEPEYMNLSRRAMEKLLPLLEDGLKFMEARKQVYPESFERAEERELLPPAAEALPDIRNPAVMRCLAELRKVVNAVIRQHGKPAEIHIELARELRNPKKQRQAQAERMRANERARKAAVDRIRKEPGISQPSPDDIRKVQLADECGWKCPYTGRQISMRKLVGPESEFQIEHIIPFSRSLDNTFVNLSLCYVEENKTKGNRTPYEAYSGNPERYEEIKERVRQFKGDRGIVAEKVRRFQMTPEEVETMLGDFSERQLRDTAYASKLAKRYLSLLYGGLSDDAKTQRVYASPGQVTAFLRNEWGLNAILKDGSTEKGGSFPKERTDHRHHAVDAVAIALTSAATVKQLSDAAQRAPLERRRRFATLQSPWPDFVDSVRQEINRIVVSHRVSKKVSGALHKDTIYSPKQDAQGFRHRRVMLTELSAKDVMNEDEPVIVDPVVRALAREKLVSLGGGDPARVFSDAKNLPCMPNRKGTVIPIRRVRIRERVKTIPLGGGRSARYAKPESNHHIEIYAEVDANGNDKKWGADLVAMHEAYARLKAGQPIVQRDHGPLVHFRFSLGPGDVLQCDDGKGGRRLLVVRSLSEEEKTGSIKVEMVRINDARQKKEIKAAHDWITKSPNELRKWHARKVAVNPLGEVREAHD